MRSAAGRRPVLGGVLVHPTAHGVRLVGGGAQNVDALSAGDLF